MKNTITVGLIKGRHEMPVDKYIFDSEIENVFDFRTMNLKIKRFIFDEIEVTRCLGYGINEQTCIIESNGYGDEECVTLPPSLIIKGKRKLIVYVTGLTCVTAQLIKCCAECGVELTLMHYNNATGEYVPQQIF